MRETGFEAEYKTSMAQAFDQESRTVAIGEYDVEV
jgi:hypothetical protein